jgi:hypothetical protein
MANIGNNGGVDAAMLTATGRESGPDIVLKVIKAPVGAPAVAVLANTPINGIITNTSSITEVLNIVAYLTIEDATRVAAVGAAAPPWYDATHSAGTFAQGPGPTAPNGFYAANAIAALDNSLFMRGAISTRLYNLDTMEAIQPAAADIIPVCIRRRNPPGGPNPFQVANVAPGNGSGNIPAAAIASPMISELMSDCVKQMINILEKTRDIFGPKGWTALFNQVKGGGGKNHAKRTHRQHRRRYSSKQY